MKLVDKYIIRSHVGPFIFGFMTVIFLFLFQFLLNYIDQLVGKGLSEWVIIQLIFLNIAWMVVLAAPMGMLFSTLMAFGGLSASHEITVIKASGGSLIRMMLPIIIIGALMSAGQFWFNDKVLPDANHRAKDLMSDIQRKKPTFSLESGKFSTEIDGVTILARHVDSISGMLTGVTIYDNRKVQETNIVSADTGTVEFTGDMSKLVMLLRNGEILQLSQYNPPFSKRIIFKKYLVHMEASGFAFERTIGSSRGDREMRISDMQKIVDEAMSKSNQAAMRIETELDKQLKHIFKSDTIDLGGEKQIRPAGINTQTDTSFAAVYRRVQRQMSYLYNAVHSDIYQKQDYLLRAKQYKVEIYKKYAIPMACLVFVFVGCPLGIITKGGNFGVSAAISLGFYIFYWACLIGGEKLADRGMITPFTAMWAGNILIGIIGIILMVRISNESLRLPFAAFLKKLFSRNK
ncbi:MAG: lipopolysaccharide export system permease protein [Bacteroidota bacterium]|nr:lipopolysaccharide export system permease protein [Bacteroidota bacterium]